jgi:hypothetical protein
MQLQINITDESKAMFLIELLRSLDYVQISFIQSDLEQAQKEQILQAHSIAYDNEFKNDTAQELAENIALYQQQQQAEKTPEKENWEWLENENIQVI